ncbi:MAG: hypothetical protein AAF567_21170 [Actinomycetota bacterium]
MSHLGYLIAGWGLVLGSISAYAASLLRRGRVISAQVSADRQRWMTTDESAAEDDA